MKNGIINKLVSKLGLDKITHFLSGSFIHSILYIIISNNHQFIFKEKIIITLILNLIVLIIGIIRELTGDKFDIKDLIYTILGSIIITIIILI